jgi:hypothetical protein
VQAITTHLVAAARKLAVTKRAVKAGTWRRQHECPMRYHGRTTICLQDGMLSAELIFTIVYSAVRRVDW